MQQPRQSILDHYHHSKRNPIPHSSPWQLLSILYLYRLASFGYFIWMMLKKKKKFKLHSLRRCKVLFKGGKLSTRVQGPLRWKFAARRKRFNSTQHTRVGRRSQGARVGQPEEKDWEQTSDLTELSLKAGQGDQTSPGRLQWIRRVKSGGFRLNGHQNSCKNRTIQKTT